MSAAETPLQYAERVLAGEKASLEKLQIEYEKYRSEAAKAKEHIEYKEAARIEKMRRAAGHLNNNPQAKGAAIEDMREIRLLKRDAEVPERIMISIMNEIHRVEASILEKEKAVFAAKDRSDALAATVSPRAVRARDAWAEPVLSNSEYKALAAAFAAAKPSFFGRLGRFFGRSPAAPAVAPRAPSNARAARQREQNAISLAGSPRYNGAPAGPLIRPSAAARAARYAEVPYADPYSSARYGGKTKRRHTKRRKSRKARKSRK